MARKPVPGSDGNNWGTILNEHLDYQAAQVAAVETAVAYAMTRVNAAAYSTLQDALDAGAGKTVYIGPGQYSISTALTVAPGTTVELHPNAVIEQTTPLLPIFDLLDVPNVRLIGGQFEWNGSRAFTSGSGRGSASMDMNAAIWTNSDGTVIEGITAFGFMSGVTVSGWNGTALTDGYARDVAVTDAAVDTVNFGVLAYGTTNLNISRLRGTYDMFTTGTLAPPPPHLIYFSEGGGRPHAQRRAGHCGLFCGGW